MSKKQKATDPSRFEGNGISYRAKLIGVEDVAEARGDKMCQETLQKLKSVVKTSGQHKPKVYVNVTLEGMRIVDGVTQKLLHTHPVHQISFISRDVTDSRAFGYVFACTDGSHKFFAIKTASSAENVVLALRDLFQTVYEMKKQEVEVARVRAASFSTGAAGNGDTATDADSGSQATDVTEQTQASGDTKTSAENEESVQQDTNFPVDQQQQQEEAVANLLDLEDQVDTILKGIEQIKNLDFEETPTFPDSPFQASFPADLTTTTTTSTSTASPDPSATPTSSTAAFTDPWGMPAAATDPAPPPAKTASSSALDDLEGLSSPAPPTSNPFGGMQALFSPAPASTSAAFFGMGQAGVSQAGMGQPGMGQAQPSMPFGQQGMMSRGMGFPVTGDPFSTDPFSTSTTAPPAPFTTPHTQAQSTPQMMGASANQFTVQQSPFSNNPFPPATTMGGANPAPTQPFPGNNPTQAFPVSNPAQAFPGSNPAQAFPGNNPAQAFPGNNPAQAFPGNNPAFPGSGMAPRAGGLQPGFGTASPAFGAAPPPFAPFGSAPGVGMGAGAMADPFQTAAGDVFLQPAKPAGQEEKGRAVSPAHAPNLFNDLVDIKKASPQTAKKSPKELFPQPPKKTLNDLKGESASQQTNSSPFGDSFFSTPVNTNGKPSDSLL